MRISNWKDTAGVDGHGEISYGKPRLTKICSATDDDGTYCQLFKKKSVLSFQTSLSLQIKLRSQITRGDTTHDTLCTVKCQRGPAQATNIHERWFSMTEHQWRSAMHRQVMVLRRDCTTLRLPRRDSYFHRDEDCMWRYMISCAWAAKRSSGGGSPIIELCHKKQQAAYLSKTRVSDVTSFD